MCWLTPGGEIVRGAGGAGGGCNQRVEKAQCTWGPLGNAALGRTRALTQCLQQTTWVQAPRTEQEGGSAGLLFAPELG